MNLRKLHLYCYRYLRKSIAYRKVFLLYVKTEGEIKDDIKVGRKRQMRKGIREGRRVVDTDSNLDSHG